MEKKKAPEQSKDALRRNFIEPPFSVLDTKSASWKERKEKWLAMGIKSEEGRDVKVLIGSDSELDYMPEMKSETSIFDPALCELMYTWFCVPKGKILDPFAGGSVRGIVAHKMGFDYTGIELREEQVKSNVEQGQQIIPENPPKWICGDSNQVLNTTDGYFDMVFSCPPYADLEVYSDKEEDLSNMPYEMFLRGYRSIISKAVSKLKDGSFAVFVVGDVRGKDGYYYDLISDTKKAFIEAGAGLYNEAILLDPIGTAMIRANGSFASKKLVKVHQNVLIFKKKGELPLQLRKRIEVDYVRRCDECGGKIKGHYCEDCLKEFK